MNFIRVAVYPTQRSLMLGGAGAALALLASLVSPTVLPGVIAALAVIGLILLDGLLGASGKGFSAVMRAPLSTSLGERHAAHISFAFAARSPKSLEVAIAGDDRIGRSSPRRVEVVGRRADTVFAIEAQRRGRSRLDMIWVRWTGPLGLVWRQRSAELAHDILVTADVRPARNRAVRQTAALNGGQRAQLAIGSGTEFDSLREFPPSGDRRSIDWKRSATHGRLLSKEFRLERNHTVALVFDTGRQMCEPFGGAPRIDTTLAAGLSLAWGCLSGGDRVKLFAFDSEVRLTTGFVSGARAFPALVTRSGELDYSTEETNYTLGLYTLASELDHRSIVVIFTEFTDPTGAELMLQSIGRLVARHVVIFVTFRDTELERLVDAAPSGPRDVATAVVAQGLLEARSLVLKRLRRVGVRIVETTPEQLDTKVFDAFIDAKRRGGG